MSSCLEFAPRFPAPQVALHGSGESAGKMLLDGPRADEAMQWMCGADLEGKPVGAVTYTPLCNVNGGVEADLTVTKLGPNRWYLVTGGATQSRDKRWMLQALEMGGYGSGATLTDLSEAITLLSVQGPLSHRLLQPLSGCGAAGGLPSLDEFPFSTATEIDIAGVPSVRCLRLTFVGELGFELHLPVERAEVAYEAVRAAGEALERESGKLVRDAGYELARRGPVL